MHQKLGLKSFGGRIFGWHAPKDQPFSGHASNSQKHAHDAQPPGENFKTTYILFKFCVWATLQDREFTTRPDIRSATYKNKNKTASQSCFSASVVTQVEAILVLLDTKQK